MSFFTVFGERVSAGRPTPGLHLVATPIGNLEDITLRALKVLAGADLIACEDTRVSRQLTRHYGIATPLSTYHDHNAARQRPALLKRLGEGAAIALISDAGTPLISDPGYKLAEAAIAAGHGVHVVPGASAALAALLLSGLPSDRFFFEGFLPVKQVARHKRLERIAAIPGSLIVYEAPTRLAATLADMAAALGSRQAAICREITKFYEEVLRGSLAELAGRAGEMTLKGEIVIVVAPPGEGAAPGAEAIDALLQSLLPHLSVKDAALEAARRSGLKRRDLYERALALKADRDA